jgi:O-antigen/teichoic acid export membrane protein
VGLILGARIGQALFYFYFAAKTEEERETCVSTLYFASMMIGLLCLAMMPATGFFSTLVFGDPRYAGYLKLVFASFAVSMVGELNLCYLRARGFAGRYVTAMLVTLFLNVTTSLVLLLGLHMGVKGVLIASLASSAVTGVWLAWSGLSGVRIHVDWALFRRLLVYSIPVGLSSLAMFLVHYGDRLFLRPYVTLAQLGVYSLAYKFAMVVPNCHMPFILHWNAQVGGILEKPTGPSVYIRSCTYLTAGMALVGVTIALFIRPLLAVMAGPAFFGAGALVPLLVLAYVIRAVGAHLQSIFIAEGRPGLDARVSIVGAAVCMAAYAVLIPQFKLWGAVIATLLGFLTILIYGTYLAQRLRRFDLEYGRMLRIAGMGCLIVAGFYAVPVTRSWQAIGLGSLAWAGYVAWLFQWGLDENDRHGAIGLLKQSVRKASSNRWSSKPLANPI